MNAFQSYGQYLCGAINDAERKAIIQHACPGAGACGGMYTANIMACAIEALGMSLPYSSSTPAMDIAKSYECKKAGVVMAELLALDLKPKDIMTRKAFENAIVLVIALGGSTNVVLHLLAMAHAVNVPVTLDDFQHINARTPLLADFRPSGQFAMADLHRCGGTPAVMKLLLEEGLLYGDCMTVTGKTLAENLATLPALTAEQQDSDIQATKRPFTLRRRAAPSRRASAGAGYGNIDYFCPASALSKACNSSNIQLI